ncbi:MAG TPA: aminoacyl-histidine dipeptidase [bacterium]|nr:aminoacyl-histidine dipeptidase [bacterium]HPR86705.1 aminoacyl-histidine dipeptidase [bacterium]
MSAIAHLEPKSLWRYFDEIRKIPRGSGNEKAIGDYVMQAGKELGLKAVRDKEGNVILYKKAAPGCEKAPGVVLQGHLDMVNEKHSTSSHDFTKDPIQLILQGEWLSADGTTLGADNGIGLAAALAVLADDTIKHGALEAVFTVDEERGLNGARALTPDLLKGRILLNLDSEELGNFSIGCAGGADTSLTVPLKRVDATGAQVLYLHLSGLRGGHSGIDIHEGRGNAVKILNRLLWQLSGEMKLELVSLNGGDKHNAIPREAFAEIVLPKKQVEAAKSWLAQALEEIRQEFKPVEGKIDLTVEVLKGKTPKVLDKASKERLLGLIFALPHGPLAMSRSMKGLVETSNNVAAIKSSGAKAVILCSSRSSNMAALRATRNKLAAIAAMAGAKVEQPEGYPGWMPNVDSPLLKVALEAYKEVTGKKAVYSAIHAGLECGIIGEKFPGMDMISFGPDLKHPHSPEEKVNVKSVAIFYKHLLRILETLA